MRVRRKDLRRGKEGRSSERMSTDERRAHSTSPGFSTGRLFSVSSTAGRKFPAIGNVYEVNRKCLEGEDLFAILTF